MDRGEVMQMTIKILGGILIIVGCGGFGFIFTFLHRKDVRYLRSTLSALLFLECELQYRLTPLPELFRKTAQICEGSLSKVFIALAEELEYQISPDVQACMAAAVGRVKELPELTKKVLISLGHELGRFDLDGQRKGLNAVQNEIQRLLSQKTDNQEVRLRSYQTLGICAGAALAILFV
jgi:stage III sporulation protein AB